MGKAARSSKQATARESADGSTASGMSNWALFVWMLQFLKPVKGRAFVTCLLLLIFVGVEVLMANQVGRAVDEIKRVHVSTIASEVGFWHWLTHPTPDLRALRDTNLLLIGMVVMLGLLRYAREMSQVRLSMAMVFKIREAVYDRLQHAGFRFHDKISTGQLINRSLTDLQNVRQFSQTALLTTLEIVLTVGGYIILLLTKSWWVAVLALAPLPIWTFYILRFGKRVQPVARSVMEAEDRNVSLIAENIAGVHVIKAFATQPLEVHKYNRNADLFMARVLKRIRLFANFEPVIRGISTLSNLTLFFALGILIINGKLGVGDFLVLAAAMGSILGKLQQVAGINEQYQSAIVSSRRLHEVLHAPPSVPISDDAIDLPPGSGAVKFEHVTFGYEPNKPVLHDVSFEVKAGSTVALVGPTGSGKTTLVSLLARFYDPQQGRISIDGIDLRDVTLSSLRTQVAYVFQETYLFSDTVANNISYGRPHIQGGEVEAAARLAQAHDFIMEMPKGYETMLGERGASLSGGQRQRIAIARALLFNPRLLVLDDATASVDPETDDLIRRGMRFVMKDRTTFIIAHRISTVKAADLVLVLEDGRITQSGTHNELMQQSGHYRDIAAVQLYGAAPGDDAPSHMDRMRGRGGHHEKRSEPQENREQEQSV